MQSNRSWTTTKRPLTRRGLALKASFRLFWDAWSARLLILLRHKIWNLLRFVDRRVAARASREGPGEGDDEPSAHGCDRVGDVSFGSDRRRLWVDNCRERQIPSRARRGAVLRGEGRRGRRSGSRRRGV